MPVEAAWVAGIIEGEGCIQWDASSRACHITVSMTDYDVIERLFILTGIGHVNAKKQRANRLDGTPVKQQWRWRVSTREDFRALAEQIEPFLLSRRAAKLREVLAMIRQHEDSVTERHGDRYATAGTR